MKLLKPTALLLALFLAAAAITAAAAAVLPKGPLSYTRISVEESGGDIILKPDWPWVGELRILLQGKTDGEITIAAAETVWTLRVPHAEEWLTVPINGYAPEMVIAGEDPLTLADVRQEQRVNTPWQLAIFSAVLGVLLAMWAMKSRSLPWAAFLLLTGLGCAMVWAKLALEPHGWDEYIHMALVNTFAGQDFTDWTTWAQSFTVWNIGYLPMAIGVVLGRGLGLADQLTYRLGSMCGVIVYAAVCALAVKRTPRYKLSFLMLAAFPVSVFQAGCYTYDGVVICFALLAAALLVEEWCSPAKLTAGRAMALTAPLCLAMLPKPCYCVLPLMFLLLPADKFASVRQRRMFRMFVVALMIWIASALLLPGAYDNVLDGDARFAGTDSRAQLAFMLSEPLKALRILGGYMLREFPKMYLTVPFYLMGNYGGNVLVAIVLMAAYLLLCPMCTWEERAPSPLTAKRRITLAVLAVIPMVILTLAQYLASSAVGSETILGMQERYTLPLWPMLGLAVMLPDGLRLRTRKLNGLLAWGMIPALGGIYLVCIYFAIIRLWGI